MSWFTFSDYDINTGRSVFGEISTILHHSNSHRLVGSSLGRSIWIILAPFQVTWLWLLFQSAVNVWERSFAPERIFPRCTGDWEQVQQYKCFHWFNYSKPNSVFEDMQPHHERDGDIHLVVSFVALCNSNISRPSKQRLHSGFEWASLMRHKRAPMSKQTSFGMHYFYQALNCIWSLYIGLKKRSLVNKNFEGSLSGIRSWVFTSINVENELEIIAMFFSLTFLNTSWLKYWSHLQH